MRAAFLVPGIVLCLAGAGLILYQLSESCENGATESVTHLYPWCTEVLDRINFTFVGVLGLFIGVVILVLGGPLHWILEPSKGEPEP